MKRLFLPIGVPILLVALGFAQTPAPSSEPDQIAVKGCLGGSDGNYTVAEDSTGRILKLTGNGVDLKAHLGHDVKLVGHKVNGAGTSEAAGNNLVVTEITMISERCATAAAVPAATVSTTPNTVGTSPGAAAAVAAPAETVSTPSETASTPPANSTPNVSAPAEAVTTPAQADAASASAPGATLTTPSEMVPTPPADATPNVSAPAEAATPTQAAPVPAPAEKAVDKPAGAAVVPTRPSARTRKLPAATATAVAPAEANSTPVAAAATPDETAKTPAAPVSPPPAKSAMPVWSGSPGILVSFIVLVLVIGALTPLVNRWRKRKLLEQTSAQNLSFTHRASSDPGEGDKPDVGKAA